MSDNSDLNNGNNDDQIDKMTDVVEVEDFSDEVDEEPKCDDDDDVSGGGESDTGREPRTRGRHTYIPQEEDDDNGVYDEEEEPQYPQHPIDSDAFDEDDEEEEEEEDKKTPHITDEIKEVFGDDEEEEERIAEEERLEEEKRQREEEDEENERRREEEEEDQKRRAEEEEEVRRREEEEEEMRRAEEEEEEERRREEEESQRRRDEEADIAKRYEEEVSRAEEAELTYGREEVERDARVESQEGSVEDVADGVQSSDKAENGVEDESLYSDDVIHDDNTSEEVNDKVGDAPNDEVCPDSDHEVGDAVDVDELEAESKDGGIHDKEVYPEDESRQDDDTTADASHDETLPESVEYAPNADVSIQEPVEAGVDAADDVELDEEQSDGEVSDTSVEKSDDRTDTEGEELAEEEENLYCVEAVVDEHALENSDGDASGAQHDNSVECSTDEELEEEECAPLVDDGLAVDAPLDSDVANDDIREITLYRATKDGAVGAFWSDSKPLDRLAAKTDYQLPIFYEGDTPDKSTYNNRDSVVTGKIKVDGEGYVLNYDTEEPITIPRYSDDGDKVGYERVRYDDRLKDIEVIPSNGMNEANVTPSALNDTCVADRNILAPANRRDLIDIDGRLVTGKHEISFANKGMSKAESDAVVKQVVKVVDTEKLGYHSNFAKHMEIERALKSKK